MTDWGVILEAEPTPECLAVIGDRIEDSGQDDDLVHAIRWATKRGLFPFRWVNAIYTEWGFPYWMEPIARGDYDFPIWIWFSLGGIRDDRVSKRHFLPALLLVGNMHRWSANHTPYTVHRTLMAAMQWLAGALSEVRDLMAP